MQSWDTTTMAAPPNRPEIVSSSADARAIVLHLPAGERLQEHEVRERAFVVVVSGEVDITASDGTQVAGGPGLLVEFEPGERHEVVARSDTRFLLLLTPWPARDHAGTMTLEEKAAVRSRAAEHAERRVP